MSHYFIHMPHIVKRQPHIMKRQSLIVKRQPLLVFFAIALLGIAPACRKTKVNDAYALTGVQVTPAQGSVIRIFNFYNAPLDVQANNVPLTAFSADGNAQGNQVGLSIFPSGVWAAADDGNPVTMPVSLLDKSLHLHLIIRPRNAIRFFPGLSNLPVLNIDTVITNDPLHPRDYYAMGDGHLKVIDRNANAPSGADRFKIRILNYGAANDTLGLSGAVVLTYADGTPVDPVLSYVDSGKSSPYIELPYGSYQFKLYIAKSMGVPDYTKQLAELPVYPDLSGPVLNQTPQQDLVTRVRGFKPGGTYTLLVAPNIFGYDMSGQNTPTYFLINAYHVLTELSAPRNISFARLQGVNALDQPGINALSLAVDGRAIAGNITFGSGSDYATVIQGTHEITALDASGNVLAKATTTLYPYDNITAWVMRKNGRDTMLFSNTDLTSTLYESTTSRFVNDGTDGSVNTWHFSYAIQTRFMNLSDVPYVTFTKDGVLFAPSISGNSVNNNQNDTLAYPQAFINLQPGVPVLDNPFVLFPVDNPDAGTNWTITTNGQTYVQGFGSNRMGLALSNPVPIRAFASQPANGAYNAVVPGVFLDVAPLTVGDFAAGTQIYPTGALRAENGFYTVALIGNLADGSAKLIAVKHNK